MASLTLKEKHLLHWPPTKATWLCTHISSGDDPIACSTVNTSYQVNCFICRHPKPKRPKLLYPEYLAACKKAGIEPGTPWPPKATLSDPPPARPPRRKKG